MAVVGWLHAAGEQQVSKVVRCPEEQSCSKTGRGESGKDFGDKKSKQKQRPK